MTGQPLIVCSVGSITNGIDQDSKALAEQVRPISVERVSQKVGTVPPALMLAIDDALRLHLAL